jgi:3',5'-cyclic AMP phosphodiesterase CpdA
MPVITGAIANHQEVGPPAVQSSTDSWAQFQMAYVRSLTLRDNRGAALPIFLTPGNHDVSNAIGYGSPD